MTGQNVGQVELDLVLNSKSFRTQMQSAVGDAVGSATKSLGTSATGSALGKMGAGVGKLSGSLMKLGKIGLIVGATVMALKPALDFSKEAIALGSDMQEVQNVVDSTFQTLNKQVDEFASHSILNFGIDPTNAKKYMGTMGAMAQSIGFTEKEAFQMSKTLTGLVGDVASFYNLSHDVAYTKMKAVFTGETESLKELGIVMTQSALDEFARREGIMKTTAAMSEQEKTALRYRFILDRLKTASGDFIRTQNGWANQTRILSVQWNYFKATIGQAFINVLTPIIKMLNLLISKLIIAANAFKRFTDKIFGLGGNGNGKNPTKETEQATEQMSQNIGSAAGHAAELKKSLLGIDQLNILQDNSAFGGLDGGGGAGGGDVGIGEDTALPELPAPGKTPFQKWWEDFKADIAPEINGIKEDWADLCSHMRSEWQDTMRIYHKSWNKMGAPMFNDLKRNIRDLAGPSLTRLTKALLKLVSSIIKICKPLYSLFIKPFVDLFVGYLWPAILAVLTWIADALVITLEIGVNVIAGFIRSCAGLITFLAGVFTLDFEDTWNGLAEFFIGIWDMIWGTVEPILDQFGIKSEDVAYIFQNAWNDTCTWFKEKWEWLSGWFDGVMEDMAQSCSDIWNSIVTVIKWPLNKLIGLINRMIERLNKLHFKLPNWMGGHEFGFNIGYIPYLAQGGYVGANSPQLAMIGDNRHEGEIVAPESKLLEAVQMGTAPLMQAIQTLVSILTAQGQKPTGTITIPISLDGYSIAEYVIDLENQRIVRNGGY